MPSRIGIIVVLAVQLFEASAIARAGQPPGPFQLQQHCLDYRTLLTQSGSVSFNLTIENFIGDRQKYETHYEAYFESENLRIDLSSSRDSDRTLQNPSRFIFQDERYFWFPRPDLEGTIAPVEELSGVQGGAIGHFVLFHPFWIGMGTNPEAQLQANPATRILAPQSRQTPWQEPERINNSIWRIRCDASSKQAGGELLMDFDVSRGFSLVRAVARILDKDGTTSIQQRITSDIQKFPFTSDSGERVGWFPRKVIRETFSGDSLTSRQTITVKSAQFGVPPEITTFSVEGLGLTKGARISDRTRGKQETRLQWDGEQAIPIFGPTADRVPAPKKRRDLFTPLVVINGLTLMVVALFVLLRGVRKSAE